jgi:hypothetical protein
METWKEIKGYEGLYEVSNLGRVKALRKTMICGNGKMSERVIEEKILKQGLTVYGYKKTWLTKNGKQKTYFVHRLVASSFILNIENKPQENHKDGNKLNNNLSNLEWATAKENINHAVKNKLLVPKSGKEHYLYNNPTANHQYGKKGVLSPNYGKKGKLSPSYGKCGFLASRSKIVIDMGNGIFYECVKEAATLLGYKYNTLKKMIDGKLVNKTNLRYA